MKDQERVAWGWANPVKWQQHIWIRYKINTNFWRGLWDRQEGRCAGCKEEFAHPLDKVALKTGLKPEVDHQHLEHRDCEERDVRGLLCRSCNDLLGKIQDNKTRMENLVAYLKAHGDY